MLLIRESVDLVWYLETLETISTTRRYKRYWKYRGSSKTINIDSPYFIEKLFKENYFRRMEKYFEGSTREFGKAVIKLKENSLSIEIIKSSDSLF